MSILFTQDDWEKTRKNYTKWWDRELDRPLIPVLLAGRDPGRPQPDTPLLTQKTCADLSIPAKDLIDRIDYELSKYEYLGDAFPYFNMDCFGPGIAAAFLGAKLDNSSGRVWFMPEEILPIDEIHFEFDSNNIWLNRIKEICYEGMQRWHGQVLLGMPDLGGIFDILSVFRPSENLFYDLYDEPDEVKRLIGEIHELWLKFYHEISGVLQSENFGYCDWSRLYSDKPSYVIQSDASYMISTQMFDEFVKPELESMCKTLDRTLYHLDGVGQLNHLDSLLSIKELDAVQWVPGDGKAPQREWPEVMQKIHSAGKNMQIFDGFEGLDSIASQIGTFKGLQVCPINGGIDRKEEYLEKLKAYHVL